MWPDELEPPALEGAEWDMRDAGMDSWSKMMIQLVNSDAYARANGTMLDTWLGVDSQAVLNAKWEHIAELKPKA